jgi:negative regulator of flagellin synthesis FlgM
MTNAISQYGRMAQPEGNSRSAAAKTDSKIGNEPSILANGETALAQTPQLNEANVLSLSNVTQRIKDEPDFDRAKVDAIKEAINNGHYPLNPRRIAESFVAIEQMIRD